MYITFWSVQAESAIQMEGQSLKKKTIWMEWKNVIGYVFFSFFFLYSVEMRSGRMSRRLLMPMILKYLRSLEHVVSSRLRLDTTHTLCFSSPEHKADDTRLCCFSLRYRRRKEESKVYLSTHEHRRKRCTYSVQQLELSNKQIKEKKNKTTKQNRMAPADSFRQLR